MTISGAGILALGLIVEHTDWRQAVSASSVGALLYLAVAGSGIAFYCMFWVLQRTSAGIVGMASLTFPVIAIAAGVLFGGEHFGTRDVAGTGLVLLGMAIALAPIPARVPYRGLAKPAAGAPDGNF
jgi:drug/metabolite transporter (DMT)-like permease